MDPNFCVWSHFNRRDTPLLEIHRFMIFIAISAVVFDPIFAMGNLDHISIVTNFYASFLSSTGRGPMKTSDTSSFGSNTGSIRNDCSLPTIGFRFLPGSVQCRKY